MATRTGPQAAGVELVSKNGDGRVFCARLDERGSKEARHTTPETGIEARKGRPRLRGSDQDYERGLTVGAIHAALAQLRGPANGEPGQTVAGASTEHREAPAGTKITGTKR